MATALETDHLAVGDTVWWSYGVQVETNNSMFIAVGKVTNTNDNGPSATVVRNGQKITLPANVLTVMERAK